MITDRNLKSFSHYRNQLLKARITNPLVHSVPYKRHLTKILILEWILKKHFLWASRLWDGRRKHHILSSVTKNNEIKTSCSNGLNSILMQLRFTRWPSSKPDATNPNFWPYITSLMTKNIIEARFFFLLCGTKKIRGLILRYSSEIEISVVQYMLYKMYCNGTFLSVWVHSSVFLIYFHL